MADNSRTVMTDAGFALEAKVRADETKMQFTRATISTDDHFDDADDALAKLGTLDNVQQDGAITDVKVIDDTTVHVQVDVDQTKAPADYAMLSAGLYARDGDDNEILYGVIVLKDPAYVHKDDDGSYLGFGIDTVVGRAANVTIAVSPANVVTQQAFSSVMADYYDKTAVENLLKNYVTDDDFASKLPKNIATTDAANTFAKSQTLAGGATDGKGNAYATTKDVATDLNNGLSTKVTDNKNGTEQLNGVQVQPFNKLSDTIGGRNLLPGTSGTLQTVTNASNWATNTPVITPVVPTIDSDTTYTVRAWISPASHDMCVQLVWQDSSNVTHYGSGNFISAGTSGYSTRTETITAGSTIQRVTVVFAQQQSTPSSVSYKEMKLEQGSVATDWTPAPEDKVNVTDMRKPANDVAGIEEVSTLQTQVDNSVVGTNLLTGTGSHTVTLSNNYSLPFSETTDDLLTLFKELEGQTVTASIDYNYSGLTAGSGNNRMGWELKIIADSTSWFGPVYYPKNDSGSGRVSSTFVVPKNITGIGEGYGHIEFTGSGTGTLSHFKLEKGSVATDWCPNPSEILTKADDSKVAHLSGTNNFDTVPTVNTHPLLLASSLPSDLARLSQDANFTAKLQQNGQDVALANNTIARNPDTGRATDTTDFPYKGLTVDGYPIIPLVLVPDRATAITKTAQYPNYAFMYGKELS